MPLLKRCSQSQVLVNGLNARRQQLNHVGFLVVKIMVRMIHRSGRRLWYTSCAGWLNHF
jgi:hypothetical protein